MPSTIQPALILIALLSVVKSVYKILISFLRFEFFGTHGTVSGTMTKSYKNNAAYNSLQTAYFGGKRGIRTPGTVTRTPHFECGPFDHSGIFPLFRRRTSVCLRATKVIIICKLTTRSKKLRL